jgi:hypothetical protein
MEMGWKIRQIGGCVQFGQMPPATLFTTNPAAFPAWVHPLRMKWRCWLREWIPASRLTDSFGAGRRFLWMMVLGMVCLWARRAPAAVWQWSVPEGGGRAFLWIPPECEKVRAVVVAQHNMLEESVLEHAQFREELGRLGIAEMWVVPRVAEGANIEDGAGERMLELLGELADVSGYEELGQVPVVPMGHSACATVPWNFAARFPGRTLAVLSIHGDAPQTDLTGNGRPRMDWDDLHIDGIPGLFVIGQYEWMEERVQPALEFRKRHPRSCIAMLAEPGEGHFDASDDLVGFLAMFVRKSVEARLTDGGGLKAVDASYGWLVGRWEPRGGRDFPPAPVNAYRGDPADAFWAIDGEMAKAIHGYHADQIGKKPQLLSYVQEGDVVAQMDRHEQVKLRFLPEKDGVTFTLETGFLSEVEGGSSNLPRWTGLPVGSPLGHSSMPTRVVRITGPFAELGDNRFELRLNRSWSGEDKRNNQLWFAARNPGDAHHGRAVQQAMMILPANTAGRGQTISFPEIGDVKVGITRISLSARSDVGLRVRYYVREGPAEVDGDILKLTAIPPGARFPVSVTVVAWQWGNADVNTATPVTRKFEIHP